MLFRSPAGALVDFGLRCLAEGHEVKQWVRPHGDTQSKIGRGLIDRVINWQAYARQADLIVFKTSIINESSDDGKWFFVDAKSKSDNIICYVKHINEASLVIYFTDNKLIAGHQPNKRKIQ